MGMAIIGRLRIREKAMGTRIVTLYRDNGASGTNATPTSCMFNWFKKRKDRSLQTAAGPTSEPPAALQEMSRTMPASLETWAGMDTDASMDGRQARPAPLFWMLGAPEPVASLLIPDAEVQLLRSLDTLLAARQLPDNLLPRAPAVIPQLLGLLRREQPSRTEVARQVSKDMQLTAEVSACNRPPCAC